jgi:hypothetical protein
MPIAKRSINSNNLGAIRRLRIGLLADLSQQDFQTKISQNVIFKPGLNYLFDMGFKDFNFSDLEVSQDNTNGLANNVFFSLIINNDLISSNFDHTYRRMEGRLLVAEITTMNDTIAVFAPLLATYKYNQGSLSESPTYTFSFQKVASIVFADYVFPKLNNRIIGSITSVESTTNTFKALVSGINTFQVGIYECGYSLVNDIDTVIDWFSGVVNGKIEIPNVKNKSLLYVFCRKISNTEEVDMMLHLVNVLQYSIVSTMISLDDEKPNVGDLIEFDGSNTVIN